MPESTVSTISADPLWYKDAIIYELHVRSFCDGNADGIGDIKGLTGLLDDQRSLGVYAILLPRQAGVLVTPLRPYTSLAAMPLE